MQSKTKNDNITPHNVKQRQQGLSALLENVKTDSLLLTDLQNIRYFCGFTGSSAHLLVTNTGNFFFTDGRYEVQAQNEVFGADIIVTKKMLESVKEIVSQLGINKITFEAKNLSYYHWEQLNDKLDNVELQPLKDEVKELRKIKDKKEVECIKKGANIAKDAFFSTIELVKPGVREIDVALALEVEIRKRGAEKVSFDIIVASGKRSALPHAVPTEKTIDDGDLVVIDFGVVVHGYHTDETCTMKVGCLSSEAKEIYSTVNDAQRLAIEVIRPGVKACDIDATARDHICNKGYGQYFGHGTGHGVGLDVHELPVINEMGETVLEEGMVFTVEPGIYLPEVGGVRIEDMVLVTESGYDVLTKCNDELRG